MLKRGGTKTDPCGTPFLRRRNLLLLPFLVERIKLRLPTISMIMWTMCLSGSNCKSLQVRPWQNRTFQSEPFWSESFRSGLFQSGPFQSQNILVWMFQSGDISVTTFLYTNNLLHSFI